MIWWIIILAAAALAVLEKIWAPTALKALRYQGQVDRIMAGPGETVTWSGTMENHSRLPIPFVRLRLDFPIHSQVQEEEAWVRSHCTSGLVQWHAEERLALGPRQSSTRRVRMTFSRRGEYRLGQYVLSAGDLLGLEENSKFGEPKAVVIIPGQCKNQKAVQALGGFLGDISVRRFILEDPVLTVGFRDYTGREPLKAVSWTRTAVTGTLQVKQYDHTAEQTVTVLLNVEGGTGEELEGCFRLTRMVCEQLERNKIPFSFRTNGNLPAAVGKLFRLAEGLGSRHVRTIVYALGRADYTCYFSFRTLVRQTLRQRKNNESYIVITPSANESIRTAIGGLEAAVSSQVCVLEGREEAQA